MLQENVLGASLWIYWVIEGVWRERLMISYLKLAIELVKTFIFGFSDLFR